MPEQRKAVPEVTAGVSYVGILLVVLATAFWSTSGIFISLVVEGTGITPIGLAFWRDISTFFFLVLGVGILKPDLLKVRRRDYPWLAAMGAISIGFFHVLWNISVLVIGVSVATVIQCNAPIFVTLMAWIIWGESLTRYKIIAILLASLGIVLISGVNSLESAKIPLYGLVVALSSAIFYGSFSLFGKKLVGDYSPWTILTYVFGFATLALLPFQLGRPVPLPQEPVTYFYFLALVVVTTITGFGLYTNSLSRLEASIASIVSNTEVPFAAILSYIILGERLDAWQILGALLVVGGVSLISIPQRKRLPKSIPETKPSP